MQIYPWWIRIIGWFLVAAAILCFPLYSIILIGGSMADRIGQRRNP